VVTAPAEWTERVTPEERERLGSLVRAQLQGLYILQLGARHGIDWQTPAEVAAALQNLGIAITAVGGRNTLDAAAVASPRLVIRSASRRRSFRLAQPGERALAATLGGSVTVVRIEAQKPLTARAQLTQILANLRGIVRISDPYYGARSADALAACASATDVRLITGKCGGGENESSARRVIVDLTKEHRRVQVRVAPSGQMPHDRYVLTDSEMILVGHGLKDIGSRESFMIAIPRNLLTDIATQTEAAFDSLWSVSTPITT